MRTLVFTKNNTGFMIAAANGHKDIVEFLYNQNPRRINEANTNGDTAFLFAASHGHKDIVEFLYNQNPTIINQRDLQENTAFLLAANIGYIDIVKFLCNKDSTLITQVDKNGNTALMSAAFSGKLEIVKFLIEQGADILARSKDTRSALDMAKSQGHTEVLQYLQNQINLLLFKQMEYFAIPREEEVDSNLLSKVLQKYTTSFLKDNKDVFISFLSLHKKQVYVLDKDAKLVLFKYLKALYSAESEPMPDSLAKIILSPAFIDNISVNDSYKILHFFGEKFGQAWLLENGFDLIANNLVLIKAISNYIANNATSSGELDFGLNYKKAIAFKTDLCGLILSNSSALERELKGPKKAFIHKLIQILKTIEESNRTEDDNKVIKIFDSIISDQETLKLLEAQKLSLKAELESSYKVLSEKITSYNKQNAGAKQGSSKSGAKKGAKATQVAITKEAIFELLDSFLTNSNNLYKIDKELVLTYISKLHSNLSSSIKQDIINYVPQKANDAKKALNLAISNIMKTVDGAELSVLSEELTIAIDNYIVESNKHRLFSKNPISRADISSFIERISNLKMLDLMADYDDALTELISKISKIYDPNDTSGSLSNLALTSDTSYESSLGLDLDDSASIGIDTYIGAMSSAGSIAYSTMGIADKREEDETITKARPQRKTRTNDEDSKSPEQERGAPVIDWPERSDKLIAALEKLRGANKKNFSTQDMDILLASNIIFEKPTTNGFCIISSINPSLITSTHKSHGAKATNFNGDYQFSFLRDLNNLLENSGVFSHYGVALEEEYTSGSASGGAEASITGLAAGGPDPLHSHDLPELSGESSSISNW